MAEAIQLHDEAPLTNDPELGESPLFLAPLAKLLNEPRDLVFVWLMIQCAAVAACGVALFFLAPMLGSRIWWVAPGYWVLLFLGVIDRFTLMLHCTSHRQLFKARHGFLNSLIPDVLGPFHGQTPEAYFVHHMGMHHREENLAADVSSTMRFQRDRFTHWLRYWGRFLTIGIFDLARYHSTHGNAKLLKRLIVGEGIYWVSLAALLWWRPAPAVIVFVVPLVAMRTLMMAGNWGQHAFIDPAQPGNPYRSSITCINSRYNRRCFNDGYHIHHHVQARCHWTDYPAELKTNLARYVAEDAIVFEGVDFFMVWLYLMVGHWNGLAKAFVRLPGAAQRTDAEAIAFLKSRLGPFDLKALEAR